MWMWCEVWVRCDRWERAHVIDRGGRVEFSLIACRGLATLVSKSLIALQTEGVAAIHLVASQKAVRCLCAGSAAFAIPQAALRAENGGPPRSRDLSRIFSSAAVIS